MGNVYGTCGHILSEDEIFNVVSIMGFTREGERAIIHGSYCYKCVEYYKSIGLVLFNDRDVNDWLSGKLKYPIDYD